MNTQGRYLQGGFYPNVETHKGSKEHRSFDFSLMVIGVLLMILCVMIYHYLPLIQWFAYYWTHIFPQ